jgi:hypothetical protein
MIAAIALDAPECSCSPASKGFKRMWTKALLMRGAGMPAPSSLKEVR